MAKTTFRETMVAFWSYVKLLLFLGLVGVGGWYLYNNRSRLGLVTEAKPMPSSDPSTLMTGDGVPVALESERPSLLLAPVLTADLPLVWGELDATPVVFSPDFDKLEGTAVRQARQPGRFAEAWKLTAAICREARASLGARNAMAAALPKPKELTPSKAKHSKADIEAATASMGLFLQSAQRRWRTTSAIYRQRLDGLNRQLMAAEAKAE